VTSGEPDPRTVERLLRSLPEWFGIESSLVEYVAAARRMPAYLAWPARSTGQDQDKDQGQERHPVGALLAQRHFPCSAEIHLIAGAAPSGTMTSCGWAFCYADGRRAATTGVHYRPPDDDDDGRLVLQQGGGGGSSRSQDWDFWVHPLPPDGPVTLVGSWVEHGIAESRAELDGAAIRAAAGRAVTLWPEEPESEPGGAWRSQRITEGKPDDLGTRAEPDQPGAEGTGAGG
jgi:hypothetical protein